jgi:hypothetical protein
VPLWRLLKLRVSALKLGLVRLGTLDLVSVAELPPLHPLDVLVTQMVTAALQTPQPQTGEKECEKMRHAPTGQANIKSTRPKHFLPPEQKNTYSDIRLTSDNRLCELSMDELTRVYGRRTTGTENISCSNFGSHFCKNARYLAKLNGNVKN